MAMRMPPWRSWVWPYLLPIGILFAVTLGAMLVASLLTDDLEGWDLLLFLLLVPVAAFIVGMLFLPPRGWIVALTYVAPLVVMAFVNNPDVFLNVIVLIGGPVWFFTFLGKEVRLIWRDAHPGPAA